MIRYAFLAASFLTVGAMMFVVIPLFNFIPAVKPMLEYIEENGIDAGALYYTDIEEFSEAEVNMKNTMDYSPNR